MIFRQLLNESVAAASYLIGCIASGEAAVVDPSLPSTTYLLLASERGLRITAIIETHFHADYLSTGRAIAAQTGATIYAPSRDGVSNGQTGCSVEYPHVRVEDGSQIAIGQINFTALHTPGHTPEHMSYLVSDTSQAAVPWFVLTGDCLFVGDVGRADLVDLAESGPAVLYASLQRLLQLAPEVEIFPTHYGGSACGGKAMSGKPSSTIGFERQHNWALGLPDQATFISETSGVARQAVEAVLFHRNTNRGCLALPTDYDRRPAHATSVGRAPLVALSGPAICAAQAEGALLIDLRSQLQFAAGHPASAINIAFAKETLHNRLEALSSPDEALIFIGEAPVVAEAAAALAEQAQRNPIRGYAALSSAEWLAAKLPTEHLKTLSLSEFHAEVVAQQAQIVDVREPFEWEKGVLEAALLISIGDLRTRLAELPQQRPLIIACESGTRASSAASLLRRHGFEQVSTLAPDGMSDYAKHHPTLKPNELRLS